MTFATLNVLVQTPDAWAADFVCKASGPAYAQAPFLCFTFFSLVFIPVPSKILLYKGGFQLILPSRHLPLHKYLQCCLSPHPILLLPPAREVWVSTRSHRAGHQIKHKIYLLPFSLAIRETWAILNSKQVNPQTLMTTGRQRHGLCACHAQYYQAAVFWGSALNEPHFTLTRVQSSMPP